MRASEKDEELGREREKKDDEIKRWRNGMEMGLVVVVVVVVIV